MRRLSVPKKRTSSAVKFHPGKCENHQKHEKFKRSQKKLKKIEKNLRASAYKLC
jgi:hypothetical protein